MNQAAPDHRTPGKDCSRTQLTAAEKSTGWLARRMSFHVLLGLACLSCLAAVYWWYIWCVTVRVCVETYVLRQTVSILLAPGEATTWQTYFVGLDISSFSAVTLALLLTRLAWSGIRNTLWRRLRDGVDYYNHAYDAVLFSKGFASLCVQFGLLGTLLSFLLAAVAQMADTGGGVPDGPTPIERQVAEVAHEGGPGSAEPGAPSAGEDSPSAIGAGGTRELSSQVFLLLCASLVSTFVGTFVAYIVIPPLNELNLWAVGGHQLGVTDDQRTAEEFLRQLDRTTQRLSDFERATEVLVSAADGVERFQTASHDATTNFARMVQLLEQTANVLIAANQRMERLTQTIGGYEKHSERVFAQIRHFADELQKPLQSMGKAASRIQLAAVAGDRAFQDLHELAHTMRQPLAKVTEISRVSWRMLAEMRQSLQSLAGCEGEQSAVIGQAAASLEEIHGILRELLVRAVDVEQNLHVLRQANVDHGDGPSPVPSEAVRPCMTETSPSSWRRYLGWFLGAGDDHWPPQVRRTASRAASKKKGA